MSLKFSELIWILTGATLAMPGIQVNGISLSYFPSFFAIISMPQIIAIFPKGVNLLFGIGFLSFVFEFFSPTDQNFLANRFRSTTNQITTKFASSTEGENIVLWLKFSIALLGGVAITSYAYKKFREITLFKGFLLGSLVSVGISLMTLKPGEGAYLQSFGLGRTTTTFGMICTFALSLIFHKKILLSNWLRSSAACIFVLGALISGSRGAVLTSVISLFFTLIWRQKASKFLWSIWILQVILISIFLFGQNLLERLGLRAFTQNLSTRNSSLIRAQLREQSIIDWNFDPWGGIGFSVLTQGHNTYLQTLAAAGIFFFIAYVWLDIKCIILSLGSKKYEINSYIPGIVFCSVFNHLTQNQIDIPFIYMILGVVLIESKLNQKNNMRNK